MLSQADNLRRLESASAAAAQAVLLIQAVMGDLDHDPFAQTRLGEARRLLVGPAFPDRAQAVDAAMIVGGLAPWQIAAVERCIEDRMAGRLRVEDIAEAARLSPRHFSRAFKKSTDSSPHVFVTAKRIERACRLLKDTRESLADIADACGLADQAHLTRLFRQHFGETPRQWRRLNQTAPVEGCSFDPRPVQTALIAVA